MIPPKLLRTLAFSLLAFFFTVAMGVSTSYAQTTYYVDTGGNDANNGLAANLSGADGPVRTITQAMSYASDGDIISIEAGTYAENLSVTKTLTFRIRANGSFKTVEFDNLTMNGASKTATFEQGDDTANKYVSDNITLTAGTVAAGTNIFNPNSGSLMTVTGGTATGTFSFPTNMNVTYSISADRTTGSELPDDLGTGELDVTTTGAGVALTLAKDVEVGALDVNAGTGDGVDGGTTITVSGTGTTAIDDDVTANVTVSSTGAITIATVGTVLTGDLTVSPASGSASPTITLTDGQGSISGNVSVTQSGNGSVGAIDLGDGVTGNLSVTESGAGDVGAIDLGDGVSGSVSITENDAGSATSVGNISATTASTTGNISVTVNADGTAGTQAKSTGTIIINGTIGALSVTNNAEAASAIGAVTLDGTVNGNISLDAPSTGSVGLLTLNNNTVKSTSVSTEGALTLSGTTDVQGATTTSVGGNLILSGTATMTSTNTSVTGTSSLAAGTTIEGDVDANGTITLANTNADIEGTVTLESGDNVVVTAGNPEISNVNTSGTVNLGDGLKVTGNLAVSSGTTTFGGVTVQGTVDVNGGTATVDAATTVEDVDIASGATLNFSGQTLTVGGNFVNNAGTVTANATSTLAFTDTAEGATFTPGSNFAAGAVTINKTGQTVNVTDDFEVTASGAAALTITAGTLNLQDYTITVSSNGYVDNSGTISSNSSTTGGIAFNAANARVEGSGYSNLVVNLPNAADKVFVTDATDFSGRLTIVKGVVAVDDGADTNAGTAIDFGPAAANQTVEINIEQSAGITLDGNDTFNTAGRAYDLRYIGTLAGNNDQMGSELTSDVRNVTVATGSGSTALEFPASNITITGDFTVESNATVRGEDTGNRTVTINGTMNIAGTFADAGAAVTTGVVLDGDSKSHKVEGAFTDAAGGRLDITISGDNSSIAGSGSYVASKNIIDADVTVSGASATISGIQEIQQNLTVDANATTGLTLSMIDPDGAGAKTVGEIDGNLVVDGAGTGTATLTLGSEVAVGGTTSIGATGVLAFGSNDLEVNGAVTLTSGTSFSGTGYLDFKTGANLTSNGVKIPNLRGTAAIALQDAAEVSSNLDLDVASTGAFDLTVSGDAELNAGHADDMIFTGASSTVNLNANITVGGRLDINSTGTVTFGNDATARTVTVTGEYDHTKGTLDFGDHTILVNNNFDYEDGTLTMADGRLKIDASGAARTMDTNDKSVPLTRLEIVGAGNGVSLGASDEITVTNLILTSGAFDAAATGDVIIADGGTITRTLSGTNNASLADVPGFNGSTNLVYTGAHAGAITTANEFPTSNVNDITINMTGAGGEIDLTKNVTVNGTLKLTAGAFDESGGALTIATDAAVTRTNGTLTDAMSATTYSLTYDYDSGGATTAVTAGNEWTGTPSVNIDNSDATNALTVSAGSARTIVTLSLASDDKLAMGTNDLTIKGNLTFNNTTAGITGTGSLILNGSSAQDVTSASGGTTLPANMDLEINNSNGVTLKNGNLIMGAGGDVTFTAGLLYTGDNAIKIDHTSTTDQGFTIASDEKSYVVGNVIKELPTTTTSNTVRFPVGAELSSGNSAYSPMSITFDNANNLSAGIDLTVSHVTIDPSNALSTLGSNGWPIADGVEAGVDVTRYPDNFYWTAKPSANIPSSATYDFILERRSYDEYETGSSSDIADLRIVRRAGGSNGNPWDLQGDASKYTQSFQETINSSTHPNVIVQDVQGGLNNTSTGTVFTYGLKSNLEFNNASDQTANVGQTRKIDLAGLTSGGTGDYTFTASGNDAAVATGTIANDTLTISAVGTGSTTFNLKVTDDLNDSETASVSISVNTALSSSSLPDSTVNAGDSVSLTLSDYFTPGTGALTYTVTTSDAAVATAAEASGVLTVDAVAEGSATITVEAEDETGATVSESMTLTVNGAFAATGSIADQSLRDGDTSNQTAETFGYANVSGLFSGGTAPFTYTVSSSADTVATVALASDSLTVTAASSTKDGATTTITVTAEDSFGNSDSVTFAVATTPAYGDVVVDGVVNTTDASTILSASIEATTLTATQEAVADVNQDANINSFDASVTFRYFLEVSGYTTLPYSSSAKVADAELSYGEVTTEESVVTIPLNVEGSEIYSVDFIGNFDANKASFESLELTNLPEDWMVVKSTTEEGKVAFALAGVTPITSQELAKVNLKLEDKNSATEFSAKGYVNTFSYALDEIAVEELPQSFTLDQNYPNPFNPVTNVRYQLPAASDVTIELWSVTGQKVMTLVSERKEAGAHTVQVDGANLSSGVYIYRIHAQSAEKTFTFTRKMTLIK